ncbi:unnamed protein product [Rotaria sp. Silwood2]|nr:unnamed protein product [Rotaria sp. Silwood2]CAF2847386.1 unnamed protein product [Rotaria sp. Silwood2]CAF3087251.1 unnamed protein product [Rotaria sp. Silwood2]CAF3243418.1 unnamed protein product [Rotaria sp. Silwood2]CAF3963444.1 unnamed protein product [Rotaria sp. Silwood2]
MTLWNLHHQVPKRYVLSLLAFFGLFNAFILRANLSIAIVPMVNPTTEVLPNSTIKIIPAVCNWSTKTQGYILSSFFYSYTIVQIPAGFLATKFGGRLLFGGSVGFCALLALFTPLCAQGGVVALIVLRILQGFSSGFIYPSLHSIWSKWAPKSDKSKLATFAFSGSYIGTFMSMMFGGLIAVYWSWEWIFYLSGVLALAWTLAWFYLTAESPSTHTTISNEEAAYIQENLVEAMSRKYPIPWKDILTSLPVWAIIVAHFGTNWCIYIMLTELPTFITQALGFRVDTAGILAAIPWLPLAISVYGAGFLSDRLIEKYSTLYIRKLVMAISFIIIVLALLLVTLLEAKHRALIIIGITIVTTGCGPAWASFGVNHLDIGAHYAGILMGLSNSFGSTPGILVPIITGYMVPDTQLKREWNGLFMISILICILVLMFYTFFAAGDLQPWASNDNGEYQHVLNNSTSSRDVNERTSFNENNIDDLTDRLKAEIHDEKETE